MKFRKAVFCISFLMKNFRASVVPNWSGVTDSNRVARGLIIVALNGRPGLFAQRMKCGRVKFRLICKVAITG